MFRAAGVDVFTLYPPFLPPIAASAEKELRLNSYDVVSSHHALSLSGKISLITDVSKPYRNTCLTSWQGPFFLHHQAMWLMMTLSSTFMESDWVWNFKSFRVLMKSVAFTADAPLQGCHSSPCHPYLWLFWFCHKYIISCKTNKIANLKYNIVSKTW